MRGEVTDKMVDAQFRTTPCQCHPFLWTITLQRDNRSAGQYECSNFGRRGINDTVLYSNMKLHHFVGDVGSQLVGFVVSSYFVGILLAT